MELTEEEIITALEWFDVYENEMAPSAKDEELNRKLRKELLRINGIGLE